MSLLGLITPLMALSIILPALLVGLAYMVGRVAFKIISLCIFYMSLALTTFEILSSEVYSIVLAIFSISPELAIAFAFFSGIGAKYTFCLLYGLLLGVSVWRVKQRGM